MHIGKPEPDQLDPPHPLAPVLKTSESKETHRKIWKIHENPLETKVYIWENHPEMVGFFRPIAGSLSIGEVGLESRL